MRVSPCAACLVAIAIAQAVSALVFAQESGARFEVASVKPNVGSDLSIPLRPHPADGIILTNNPLDSIVRFAFGVQTFRLEGMPAWTREARFDIAAKAARPISDDERRMMLRALLVERFRMKVRFETREKTTYVMTRARADTFGPGLTPRPECTAETCASSGGGVAGTIRLRAVTLTRFAEGALSGLRGELIRDETGVPGMFDVELAWRPETSTNSDDVRPNFFTAMQEQLGLKLEPMRRPVDTLIVESIDRPTPD